MRNYALDDCGTAIEWVEGEGVMQMFVVELWGGYSGQFGNVTAKRTVYLPFVPFNGMMIIDGDNEDTINDFSITWNCQAECFTAHVIDYCDTLELHSMKDVVDKLVKDRWEIIEVDEVE